MRGSRLREAFIQPATNAFRLFTAVLTAGRAGRSIGLAISCCPSRKPR